MIRREKVTYAVVFGAIAVLVLIVIRADAPPFVTSPAPAAKVAELEHARVIVSGSRVELANTGPDPWTNVTVAVTETNFKRSGYLVNVGDLAAYRNRTVRLSEFSDEQGRRFNPFALKVRLAMIVAFLGGQKHVATFSLE